MWTLESGRLVVTLPDHGTLIRGKRATDTFFERIKRIGIERVKALEIKIGDIPLISMTDYPNETQRKVGEYYIYMNLSPEDMRNRLKRIAERLGVSLYFGAFRYSGGGGRAAVWMANSAGAGIYIGGLGI